MPTAYEIALTRIREAQSGRHDTLDLRDLELREIPLELFEMAELRSLRLMNTGLKGLPETLAQLQKLEKLVLVGNVLPEIPELIFRLHKLKELHIKGCGVRSIPDGIARLTQLEQLVLPGNEIRVIPEAIRSLKALKWLDLTGNALTSVPPFVVEMEELRDLSVFENPLETPPLEVAVNGLDAIRDYYHQLDEAGEEHLYEAKLLIVGEGGAGKTTLANKILNPDYLLRDEDRTRGIEVSSWQFPIEGGNGRFHVNIWDFGGQEIYHATHQFFLTKNSLYLLVADTRADNTDFYYWLHTVELLSNQSPLFIVLNEKYDAPKQLNTTALRGQFVNLKEVFATNLATGRGLPELLEDIRHELQQLPHVGATLPRTWREVREDLAKDPRDYISLDEYLVICAQHDIDTSEKALQLSEYLHDLGVFLHFPEGPLRKTIILRPRWATAAVYQLLDARVVLENGGRFSRETLESIWVGANYELMREELLGLMMRFEICYELADNQGFIAPQLLPANPPDYAWEDGHNLRLRYVYDFMPRGILTRLIVRMHRYLETPELAWKEGVVLTRAGAEAEIIESYDQREIRIRVTGREQKVLLGRIMDELEAIHTGFRGLTVEKLIPCTCTQCRESAQPHFYRYEDLQRRLDNDRLEVECEQSYERVSVQALIDEVRERIPVKVATHTAHDEFDVFLSYNGEDRAAVETIARALREQGLKPWFDLWELRPGLPWRSQLEKQIARVRAAAVFIGPNGIGPWQDLEVTAFINELLRRGAPVIPVVLPHVSSLPALPLLLQSVSWVDFRSPNPDPLQQLIFGISGSKPLPQPDVLAAVRRETRSLLPVDAKDGLTTQLALVRRLVARDELRQALHLLRELSADRSDLHNEVLMLTRRLKQLNKREQLGLLSEARGWIEYTNIVHAVTSLLDVMEEGE